jgi:hypothetical protein
MALGLGDTNTTLPSRPAVTLEGEKFIKAKQQNFKDLRVRGNRLVIYNQIIQPPKGITVEDTNLARVAFQITDTDENRCVGGWGFGDCVLMLRSAA